MLWLYKLNRKTSWQNRDRGFTMIEILVVMIMVGVLTAIAAPGWLGFVNNQRLSASQSRVFSTLKDAQSSAKRSNATTTFIIGNDPTKGGYVRSGGSQVQYLEQGVKVLSVTKGPVTGAIDTSFVSSSQPLTIEFNAQGLPIRSSDLSNLSVTPLPLTTLANSEYPIKIIVSINNSTGAKRCTSITTLLGSMKSGMDKECDNPP